MNPFTTLVHLRFDARRVPSLFTSVSLLAGRCCLLHSPQFQHQEGTHTPFISVSTPQGGGPLHLPYSSPSRCQQVGEPLHLPHSPRFRCQKGAPPTFSHPFQCQEEGSPLHLLHSLPFDARDWGSPTTSLVLKPGWENHFHPSTSLVGPISTQEPLPPHLPLYRRAAPSVVSLLTNKRFFKKTGRDSLPSVMAFRTLEFYTTFESEINALSCTNRPS